MPRLMSEHWRERQELVSLNWHGLGENEDGDLCAPPRDHSDPHGGWVRFNPRNPRHWRYWLYSRLTLRLTWLERP